MLMMTLSSIVLFQLIYLSVSSLSDLCDNTLLINPGTNILQEYIPLRSSALQTLIISHPCHPEEAVLIRNQTFYKFDRKQFQGKRFCISRKILNNRTSLVTSFTYLNNDLILIINGLLYRTQDIISSTKNPDIIYRLLHYFNLPILSEKIDYVFSTPCCSCRRMTSSRSISHAFNDYVLLANGSGDVILFFFQSMTLVYDFGNLFQSQSICRANRCTIVHLHLSHSLPILICIIKYQREKAIIVHQPFLAWNSSLPRNTLMNFTGDHLHVVASTTFPNAYFLWDEEKIFYTPNGGVVLSEVLNDGCQLDNFDSMNEEQLKNFYQQLEIDYDNLTIITKELFCANKTIDFLVLSNDDLFLKSKSNQWFYGKESFVPSLINLSQQTTNCSFDSNDTFTGFLPQLNQCLLHMNKQVLPCSSFVQSSCSYKRFKPLFDIHQIYILEKQHQKAFQFLLEAYTILPIMVVSTKSNLLTYSINYTTDRLDNGLVKTIGNILVSTTDQTSDGLYGSSLMSLRVGVVQYSHSCKQTPSFSFQIEASCSTASTLRIGNRKNDHLKISNQPGSIRNIEWFRQNLPSHIPDQLSPVSIKSKQSDTISLNYQYCSNETCRLLHKNEVASLLIYAVALHKKHEMYAQYLINRSDSCQPVSPSVYRLWLKWTSNLTSRTPLFQIPYERRTVYRTLLDILAIPTNSCLFFNGSKPIKINETINRVSAEHDVKFILHIIAVNSKFSFCDLETFLVLEIEPNDQVPHFYRGYVFFISLLIFLFFSIVFLKIYTCYKHQQRRKALEYHRLNQIDAGQFHQWYDIARYLNEHKHTDNYYRIQNYLTNLQPTELLSSK